MTLRSGITLYHPTRFDPVGSVPESEIAALMNGTSGRIFGSVACLLVTDENMVVLPRRKTGKRFAGSLDYAISGTMKTIADDRWIVRPESCEEALMREWDEEGWEEFAKFLSDMTGRILTMTFAPEFDRDLFFWETIIMLSGLSTSQLPKFGAEHDPSATELVPFDEAYDHVIADQAKHPGKLGLPRALKHFTETRIKTLLKPAKPRFTVVGSEWS